MNIDEQIPLEDFLISLERRGRRPTTVAVWRNSLCRFFKFVQSEGVFSVHVPVELLIAFRETLSAQGLQDATISRHESRVLAFYIWLMNKED